MRILLSLSFLLIGFGYTLPVKALNRCEAILGSSELNLAQASVVRAFVKKNPKIAAAFFKRYWRDSFANAISLSMQAQDVGTDFYVTETGKTHLAMSSLRIEDHLFVDIPIIVIEAQQRQLNFGERPEGLNTGFIKMIVGVLKGAQEIKDQNSEVRHLIITGQNILNPSLIETLKGLGFEPIVDPEKPDKVHLRQEITFE